MSTRSPGRSVVVMVILDLADPSSHTSTRVLTSGCARAEDLLVRLVVAGRSMCNRLHQKFGSLRVVRQHVVDDGQADLLDHVRLDDLLRRGRVRDVERVWDPSVTSARLMFSPRRRRDSHVSTLSLVSPKETVCTLREGPVLSMSTKGMPSGLSFITSSIDAVAETRKDARLAEEDLRGVGDRGRRGSDPRAREPDGSEKQTKPTLAAR